MPRRQEQQSHQLTQEQIDQLPDVSQLLEEYIGNSEALEQVLDGYENADTLMARLKITRNLAVVANEQAGQAENSEPAVAGSGMERLQQMREEAAAA